MGLSILAMCDEESATVPPEASAADAIKLMLERRVGAVGVVDKQGNVTGIFTERDVLKKLALSGRDPAKTQVKELTSCWASSPFATCCNPKWTSCGTILIPWSSM